MNATTKLTALMPELPTPTPMEREVVMLPELPTPTLTAEQQEIMKHVEDALALASDKGLKFCFGGLFDQKDKVIIRSHMPMGETPLALYTMHLGLTFANLPLDLLASGE